MLTITEKSRSAVQALTELAQRGMASPVPILEVAESRGIPLHFLEQLFAGLRRAGILQSPARGEGGLFVPPPAERHHRAGGGRDRGRRLTRVPGEDAPRSDGGGDVVWNDARQALCTVLAGVTIADIVEREARMQSAPMFFI